MDVAPPPASGAIADARARFCWQLAHALAHWQTAVERHTHTWRTLREETENIAQAVELALQFPETRAPALALLVQARDFILRQATPAFPVELLQLMAQMAHTAPFSTANAQVLELVAQVYQRRGLSTQAEQHYRAALALAETLAADVLCIRLRIELGRYLVEHGQAPEGLPLLHDGVAQAEAHDQRPALARALLTLGWYHHQLRDGQAALAYLQRALPLVEALGEPNHIGRAWADLGSAYWRTGDCAQAEAAFKRALTYFKQTGDVSLQTLARQRLGILHYERKQFKQAAKCFLAVKGVYERLGDTYELAFTCQNLGTTYGQLHDWARAEHYSLLALDLGRATHNHLLQVEVALNLAEAYLTQGLPAQARPLLADVRTHLAARAHDPALAKWVADMLGFLQPLEARLETETQAVPARRTPRRHRASD